MKRRKEGGGDGFEAWGGYMNAKKTKLEEQYQEEAANLPEHRKQSSIFQGVAIFVNGYSEPPAEVLRRLMLQHGGVFHDYQVSSTTHVIASNLPNSKLQQKAFAKVIRPEWIVDSVAAGKLLSTQPYLLCARSALQPALNFQPVATDPGPNVTKTAKDSGFLGEFYNKSRLHHLSTQGAMLKQYVGELRQNHSGHFPGLEKLKTLHDQSPPPPSHKVIMHIDMDCFFVSVAVRDRPDLKGRPVAVTHAKGNPTHTRPGADVDAERALYAARAGLSSGKIDSKAGRGQHQQQQPMSLSEIASCSYEARRQGVRNGMYLGRALALCPGLLTVPYDFPSYAEVSLALYDTVAEYTLQMEAVSCDELYVDCTSAVRAAATSVHAFVQALRADVTARTRCPCSAGLGPNKLLARLASKKAKPNGQYEVLKEDVAAFMRDVSIDDLPGVGWSTASKLKQLDVATCLDLSLLPLASLKAHLGDKTADTLYRFCRGEDDRVVVSEHERKSVSAEVNYGIRFSNEGEVEEFLRRLSGEVSERLRAIHARGRSLTLKLMVRSPDAPVETAKFMGHGVCDTASRSAVLPTSTNDAGVIAEAVLKLNAQMAFPPTEMRGIGIQVSKLDSKSKLASGGLHSFLAKHSKSVAQDKKPERKEEKGKEEETGIGHEEEKLEQPAVVVPETKESKPQETAKVEKKKTPEIPAGPRRGRPKKSPKKEKVQKTTLENFFQKSPKKVAPAREEVSVALPPVADLDPEVLAALPEEIRKELLAQYGVKTLPGTSANSKTGETSRKSSDNLSSMVGRPGCSKTADVIAVAVDDSSSDSWRSRTSRRDVQLIEVDDGNSRDSVSSESGGKSLFAGLEPRELTQLIEMWVEQEATPLPCDVDMLACHLSDIAHTRHLSTLNTLLTCLWRCVRTHRLHTQPWESAYQAVVDKVQAAIRALYSSSLHVLPLSSSTV